MKNLILTLLVIVALIILVGLGFAAFFSIPKTQQQIVCTMEAKICPDGTAVGRTGPNCEFTACPEVPSQTNGWKTYTDVALGITFKYPETFSTTYIHPVDWPPKVQVLDQPFVCTVAGNEIDRAGKTEQIMVNGQLYCKTTVTEGAAGSIYHQYAYAFSRNAKTIIFTFTVRQPQCVNYEEPGASACQQEVATFNTDTLTDSVIKTFQITK